MMMDEEDLDREAEMEKEARAVADGDMARDRVGIQRLPIELLEWILCLIPPYSDLVAASRVCSSWRDAAGNVMRQTTNRLYRAIAEFNIRWQNLTPQDMAPSITKRFSHAACVHGNSMYVFGGCTTNWTTFNDLWRFDLSRRRWIRPLTMGAYPNPKAYTSMVRYRDRLVLFGGLTYSSTSRYYHDWTVFDEMHYYDIVTNRWILVNAENAPPPVASHSAVVVGDRMVVFGGLHKTDSQTQIRCSNDVWVLDFETSAWSKRETTEPKPATRYGQSLIKLNDSSIMIIGGQALHNKCIYADCWMLKMEGEIWSWHEISVENKEWSSMNIWCNPAIKVGDKVVSLSRRRGLSRHPITSAVRLANADPTVPSVRARVEMSMRRSVDRDQNVNGRRGYLPHRKTGGSETGEVDANDESRPKSEDVPLPSSISDPRGPAGRSPKGEPEEGSTGLGGKPIQLPKNPRETARNKMPSGGRKITRMINRPNQFRMAAFSCDGVPNDPIPERERRPARIPEPRPEVPGELENDARSARPVKKSRRSTLAIHVLDISSILGGDHRSPISWLCPKEREIGGAPEEFIMYSLVLGKGELIMFGGIHNDANLFNVCSPQYSNSLHFIRPPRDVI